GKRPLPDTTVPFTVPMMGPMPLPVAAASAAAVEETSAKGQAAAAPTAVPAARPRRRSSATTPATTTMTPAGIHVGNLSRLRAMVLLGGSVRSSPLIAACDRSLLDLPLDAEGSIFNHWLKHATEL